MLLVSLVQPQRRWKRENQESNSFHKQSKNSDHAVQFLGRFFTSLDWNRKVIGALIPKIFASLTATIKCRDFDFFGNSTLYKGSTIKVFDYLKTEQNSDRPIDGEFIPVSVKHRSPVFPVNHTNTLKFIIRNDICYILLYF